MYGVSGNSLFGILTSEIDILILSPFFFQYEEFYLHPLDEDVTVLSLQKFLLNFTNGELRRNLTSGGSPARRKDTGCVSSSSSSTGCIVEVITDTFHEIVLDDSKVSSIIMHI